jgi:hypothetical protein
MTHEATVEALIEHQGTLYSEAMGANIARDTPQELFHWLIGAIMLSARINAGNAIEGCKALRNNDFHKIDFILERDHSDLVRVLNENGYARYDESTAGYLRDTAAWARDVCDGDLRQLRDAAESAEDLLERLQGAKGLGKVGAGIFAREAQLVWDVLYPRADGPALDAADDLGLPKKVDALQVLAGSRERFVRLLAALTRVDLEGPADAVREAAA